MTKIKKTKKKGTEIVPVEQQPTQVSIFSSDPTAAMEQMEKMVKVVSARCTGPQFIANIKGKQYPKVEWWTTIAAPLGLFPVMDHSRRLDREGEITYESKVSVRRNGQVVTAAEAICSSKEKSWSGRDEYAIKSMSITRATGKAYRIGLSMLAVMAGLEPTPADEVPSEGFNNNGKPQEFSREYRITFGKYGIDGENTVEADKAVGTKLRDIDIGYLQWMKENGKDKWLRDFVSEELQIRWKPTNNNANSKQSINEDDPKAHASQKNVKPRITAEYKVMILNRLKDPAIPMIERKKTQAWLLKNPAQKDAEITLTKLEKMIAGVLNLDDLVDVARCKWNLDKPETIDELNTMASAHFDIALIENCDQGQLDKISVMIEAG